MAAHRPRAARSRRLARLGFLLGLNALAVVALVGISWSRSAPVSIPPGPTAAPGVSQAPDDGWLRRIAAPLALTEVAAAAFDGRVWVAGGLDAQGRATDRVLILDPRTDTWSEGPTLPYGVHHSALVEADGVLYLLGGYTGDGFGTATDRVLMLRRPEDEAWLDHSRLPEARAAGAAGVVDGTLAYAGGVGPGGVSPVVFVLDEAGWRTTGALREPREHVAGVSGGDGRLWVLGGRRGGLDTNVPTVEAITRDGAVVVGDVPTPRGGVAGFWGGDPLGACLVGGESPGGTHPEVECVAGDGTVTTLAELRVPRHGLGAVVIGRTAYVVLGGPEPGLFVSDVVEALALPG